MKKVQISISGGVIKTNFEGFEGKKCDELAKKIHPEGLEIENKELKPEYNFETIENQNMNITDEWNIQEN